MSDSNNQILSLEERYAQLEAKYKEAQKESEAKDNIIDTQAEQLAAAQAQGAGQLSVVTHEGKQYQVLAGQFSLDDQLIKHDELKGKPDILKQLVKDKSPLLQLLPKEEKPAKK